MDALEQAKRLMNEYETADVVIKDEINIQVAQAYAAIAQAEQLKRIADALERVIVSDHDGKLNYILTGKVE